MRGGAYTREAYTWNNTSFKEKVGLSVSFDLKLCLFIHFTSLQQNENVISSHFRHLVLNTDPDYK